MNEILLFLSIKHFGDWMGIYDSLQKREPIPSDQFYSEIKKIKCKFTTIIDEDYCEKLKTIYKPPFGIYHYGDYDLTKNKTLTVIGSIDDLPTKYLDYFVTNNITLIWVYQPQKNVFKILHDHPKSNIFFSKDMVSQKYLKYLQKEDGIFENNMFMSEIWYRNKNHDYGNQDDERLYCGISKAIFIISKPTNKHLLSIINFANKEGVTVNILETIYKQNHKTSNKIKHLKIINNIDQLDSFWTKN